MLSSPSGVGVLWVLAMVASCLVTRAMPQCTGSDFPFRLCYDLQYLMAPESDAGACRRVGDVVTTSPCGGAPRNYTCRLEDVVSPTWTKKVVLPAVSRVQERLNKTLCVQRAATTSPFSSCCDGRTAPATECDHMVFLSARPMESNGKAMELACSSNTIDGRPLASNINFQPSVWRALEASSLDTSSAAVERMTLHFTVHVLGFDALQLSQWRDPDTGRPYSHRPSAFPYGPVAPASPASQFLMRPHDIALYNATMVSATARVMLVTPQVVATARSHFGCPTMGGVLLEELNPSVMHWERRQVNFELMATEFYAPPTASFSKFTVAAFHDMGFYRLSSLAASYVEPYEWGEGRGCAFVAECSEATWSGGVWCSGNYGTGFDLTWAAACGNGVLPPALQIPPYLHFPSGKEGSLGGWDPYADYCPYAGLAAESVVVTQCAAPRTSNAVDRRLSNLSGVGTRAVFSNLTSLYGVPAGGLFSTPPRCMQLLCVNTTALRFRAGDSYYPCAPFPSTTELTPPYTTSTVASGRRQYTISSYTFYGLVQCPDASLACATGTAAADLLMGGTRYFSEKAMPRLVNITPSSGSLAGGTVLLVSVANVPGDLDMDCRGLVIGGQPTDIGSYRFVSYSPSPTDGLQRHDRSAECVESVSWRPEF